MTTTDYSVLDRPEISMNSFYPRKSWTPTPGGAEDHAIAVEEQVALSCRFFPVEQTSPTILFFCGNGETAVDYDGIAPLYNQIGINFFASDYRGYGKSGGFPTFSSMLLDAHQVLEALGGILKAGQYTGPIFVMGRSLGRHPAFELAANRAYAISGLIVESVRPTLGQFVHGLDDAQAQSLETAYQDKVLSINVPVLVIHGELDTLAPVQQAVSMFHGFASQNKRMITIPGAGHNDLLNLGLNEYFTAIRDFVSPSLGH